MEEIGIETLLNVEAVRAFMADDKRIENLPKLYIELYLEDVVDEALEGNENSDNVPTNGIRLLSLIRHSADKHSKCCKTNMHLSLLNSTPYHSVPSAANPITAILRK